MGTGEPDPALVLRARWGDKEAFGKLVVRYHQSVLAVAYRMTGSVAAAEDVAQTAFIRAWTELGALREAGAFKSWLYRLVVNACLDQLRREPAALPISDSTLDEAGPPEAQVLEHEREHAVRQAILQLPAECRAALILREFEGLTYREIAQTLAIPLGTVMSRLSYARARLRAMLGAYLSPEAGPWR